jgi:hypothetical protein
MTGGTDSSGLDARVRYPPQLRVCGISVMADLDRITFDPTRTNGQACIRSLYAGCGSFPGT